MSARAAQDLLEQDSKDMLLIKIVFIGDSAVGKTSLIHRLFGNPFNEQVESTVGVDFLYHKYLFDGRAVDVTVWDTAGSERFAAVTASYYRGAQGIVFVYDVTRRETFERLAYWLAEVARVDTHPDTVRLIVGNKTDLLARPLVPESSPLCASPSADLLIPASVTAPPLPYEAHAQYRQLPSPSAAAGEGGAADAAAHAAGSGAVAGVCSSSSSQVGEGLPRAVPAEEAAAFARQHGCLYQECSARLDENVHDALAWGLVCAIVDTPSLHRTRQAEAPAVQVEGWMARTTRRVVRRCCN